MRKPKNGTCSAISNPRNDIHREPDSHGNCDTIMQLAVPLSTYAWLYKEIINKLDSFRRRVNEGKDLDSAREFCAFILWSGLDKILRPHDNDALKVDSSHMRWAAEELQRDIQERWRTGKNAPSVQMAEIERIHEKLDIIAGRIAQMPAFPAVEPVLRVLRSKAS